MMVFKAKVDNVSFRQVAERNRKSYKKLRLELEDLTEDGVLMLHKVDTADTADTAD